MLRSKGSGYAISNSRSEALQELIHRRDKVLEVLHPPSAAPARIMERAGCEALFVGTGGVVSTYTGVAVLSKSVVTGTGVQRKSRVCGLICGRGR